MESSGGAKTQTAIPPAKSPGLGEAMRMTASLGSFIGRKGDGEPGTKTIWIGLQRLEDIVLGWKVAISTFAPHPLPPPRVQSASLWVMVSKSMLE